MAKTAGRSRRPLGPALEQDLTNLGFVYRESASEGLSYFIWQHKRWPSMRLELARANTPGSQDVVCDLSSSGPVMTTEEQLIRRLERTISFRTNPNQFLADVEAQHAG
jgi:hypothetical protein